MGSQEKVAAYIRTSTDEQEASEQEQMEIIRDYCRRKDWEITWVRNDEISGYEDLDRRPGLRQLIEAQVRYGFTKIVVWKSERAFRNTEIALRIRRELRERGCILYGAQDPVEDDGSAEAKLVIGMTSVAAEHYRNALSDRVKASHRFKVSKGIHQGGAAPFGYHSVEGKHVVGNVKYAGWASDPEVFAGKTVAQWTVWMFEEFLRHPNALAMARHLTEIGVPTPSYLSRWHRLDETEKAYRIDKAQRRAATGRNVMQYPPSNVWDASTITKQILRSRVYLGELSYAEGQMKNNTGQRPKQKTWHPGAHEPLITPDLFNRVQALLDSRSQSDRKPADKANDVMLGGMIICGVCGRAVSRIAKNEWQIKYLCNRSRTSSACSEPRYNSRSVDQAATMLLMRGIKLRRQQILAGGQHQPVKTHDALAGELKGLEAEKERLKLMFRKGILDELELDRDMAELLPKIEAIKAKMSEEAGPGSLEGLKQIIENIQTYWSEWNLEKKQLVLRTYVPKGFRLAHGVLQATVCGLTIEVDVPTMAPPTKGMKYGAPKGSRSNSGKAQIAAGRAPRAAHGGVTQSMNPAAPT